MPLSVRALSEEFGAAGTEPWGVLTSLGWDRTLRVNGSLWGF